MPVTAAIWKPEEVDCLGVRWLVGQSLTTTSRSQFCHARLADGDAYARNPRLDAAQDEASDPKPGGRGVV
jgi:hypothetical protein